MFWEPQGAKTPGVKNTDEEEVRTPMSKERAKSYRGSVALSNFTAQDQGDISYASNEVSKHMGSPAECAI